MDTQTPLVSSTVSDPTPLTTQQLWREIALFKEMITLELNSIKEAAKLAHEDRVRVPTDIEKAIGTVKQLHEERFRGIDTQLTALEKNRLEQKADTEKILALAFSTAKEVVNKSEAAALKQMDALSDKIDDIKDRFIRSEGLDSGKDTGRKDVWGYIMGAIGLIIGILGIIAFFAKQN